VYVSTALTRTLKGDTDAVGLGRAPYQHSREGPDSAKPSTGLHEQPCRVSGASDPEGFRLYEDTPVTRPYRECIEGVGSGLLRGHALCPADTGAGDHALPQGCSAAAAASPLCLEPAGSKFGRV